jgi:BASS family bile acid:Na+ symporter
MLLLTAGSVVFMPLALPLMIPGLAADPWPILQPLLLTMLLPLGLGMFIRSRSQAVAAWLQAASSWISNISMALAVLLLLGLNLQSMLGALGTGAIAVGLAFVSLSLGAGYLLGGADPHIRSTMALGTAQRNIAAAMILAMQNFADEPGVMVMLLVTTFAGLVVLLIAARRFA